MKIFSTAAVSTIALSCVSSSTDGQRDPPQRHSFDDDMGFPKHAARQLLDGGDFLPSGEKPYITGLRYEKDGYNFCGGVLISPTHVLSASQCVTGPVRWASIGSHYINGTQDGEQIRVRAVINHPDFVLDEEHLANDFMVLELERPSKFTPVKLAAIDGSDDKVGEVATSYGWGDDVMNGTRSYELKRLKQKVVSHDECLKSWKVDDTVICAGAAAAEGICYGDWGGPLVKESPNGEDVVIGLVSYGIDCATSASPSAFAKVSKARTWIESIMSKSCFK